MPNWTHENMLLIAHAFLPLRLKKICRFFRKMLSEVDLSCNSGELKSTDLTTG